VACYRVALTTALSLREIADTIRREGAHAAGTEAGPVIDVLDFLVLR
jgi:hypothetical protein